MNTEKSQVQPLFGLQVRNWSLPGAKRFLHVIPDPTELESLANFILHTLFDDECPPPEVRSITFSVTSHRAMATMTAAAFHSVSDLDATHHTIELSEEYLANIDADRLHDEVTGICLHEMVHCFQPHENTKCPPGLLEGLADWVRLRRGLGPPHWKPDKTSRWDAGYDTTAYFLDYLERCYGVGTVARINNTVCSTHFKQSDLESLVGKGVDALWQEYCSSPSEDAPTDAR